MAVMCHLGHVEPSEQCDGTTGHQGSVRDLTWSRAAHPSATRAPAKAV